MAKTNQDNVSFLGLVMRVLAPLAIVLATYNPTGYCFYTWFMDAVAAGELGGIHFLALAVLVICWSILLIATWNALDRSEEHTSELQSLMRISYAVFCLKKKKTQNNNQSHTL